MTDQKLITLQFTERELQDLRWAISDYRHFWFNSWMAGINGEKGENFSVEGARYVYEDAIALQTKITEAGK